ncbi:MAG: DUF2628 domain-containing protein [Clostridia bacterium]|nr:DUF2628 domain-containing protein [Clostridia bacterium]
MRYTGTDCPYCGRKFTDSDDVVTCPECGTPAHRECWESAGGCPNAHKHEGGFVWEAPAPAVTPEVREEPAAPRGETVLCPACGTPSPEGTEKCPVCGLDLGMLGGEVTFEGNDPVGFRRERKEENGDAYNADGGGLRIDDIPAGEFATYLGASAPTYIFRFRRMDARGSSRSWNWAAFFFGGAWCALKGLHRVALLVLAFTFAVSVLSFTKADVAYYNSVIDVVGEASRGEITLSEYQSKLLEAAQNIPEETQAWRTYLADALILVKCLILGLYGDLLIRKKAKNGILRSRELAHDWNTYRRYLMYGGRNRLLYPALYILSLGLVRVCAFFVARLIAGV